MMLRLTIDDLKELEAGTYFDETIFNMYLKLLKLFSQIFSEMYNYNAKYTPK